MPGIRVLIASALLILFAWICAAQTTERPVNLMLSSMPAGKDPQRYPGYVQPKYPDLEQRSLYLTMRDGVKIAIDVVLPKPLAAEEKLPTIMHMTRYWRSNQSDKPAPFFPSHGYAQVFVDARGTGASFGIWRAPFSPDEIKDYGEVLDWIVKQPWSNGKVGATGNSYEGNTSLWLTVSMNPAVKAVIPRHYEFDVFSETPYPGGVLTDWMVKTWNAGNHQLDNNPGVKLVDEDTDQQLYREAIKLRGQNLDVYAAARQTTFRDDRGFAFSLDDLSLHSHVSQIQKSNAAINSWGGWFDASTADAVIRTFMTLSNHQRAVIGPWNHGGGQNASPYQGDQAQRVMLAYEWLRFFDHYLKGIDTGLDSRKLLYYFTLGEGKWKTTTTWPLPQAKATRWFFGADNSLSTEAPKAAAGEDSYTIDFEATTGGKNRWHTQVGGQVAYPDRAAEDKKLLTYTSQPLAADTEITGHAVVDLFVTSTATDGEFLVYLEDVDEQGVVTYVTEGELRALQRKISTETPPYKMAVPYHSLKQHDAMPLVPGRIAELKFALQPISVVIKKNHRLRIAISGADKDTFVRIPDSGVPTIRVARNQQNASWIELPIIPR
jgi:uncharacterized protein